MSSKNLTLFSLFLLLALAVADEEHDKIREKMCSKDEKIDACIEKVELPKEFLEIAQKCCEGMENGSGKQFQEWVCNAEKDIADKCCKCISEETGTALSEAEEEFMKCIGE